MLCVYLHFHDYTCFVTIETYYHLLDFEDVRYVFHQGQMPHLAIITKFKNNFCVDPCDLDPFQNLMSSSLAHDSPFHQVSLKLPVGFSVILMTKKLNQKRNLLGGDKNGTNDLKHFSQSIWSIIQITVKPEFIVPT